MKIEARAPAKLVLFGEYAVLEGAPALVAAVNREVRVTLEPSATGAWHVYTDFGGGQDADLPARDASGEASPWLRRVALVLDRVTTAAGRDRTDFPPLDISIESAGLFVDAGETKLGLGSSAAVVTALGAALQAWLSKNGPTVERDLAEDLATHRAVQDDRGSGVDVAASRIGGVLAYRLQAGVAHVESVALPAAIHMGVVWTGVPTSTTDFVARVHAWKASEPEPYAAQIGRMTVLAKRAVAACRDGDATGFLGLVRAYHEAMGELGEQSGVPIVSPAHATIHDLAAGEGVAYKPSGAGGGDVGLLFARSQRALVQAGRWAQRAGYRLLPLDIQPAGVTVRIEEIPSS